MTSIACSFLCKIIFPEILEGGVPPGSFSHFTEPSLHLCCLLQNLEVCFLRCAGSMPLQLFHLDLLPSCLLAPLCSLQFHSQQLLLSVGPYPERDNFRESMGVSSSPLRPHPRHLVLIHDKRGQNPSRFQ